MRYVTIDGDAVPDVDEDVESVVIEMPEVLDCPDCGGELEDGRCTNDECEQGIVYDNTNPEVWVNSAGVRITDDGVQVWVSTGDPRGAFQMEIRRVRDGRIYLHVPHADASLLHEDLTPLHAGTFALTRSIPRDAD